MNERVSKKASLVINYWKHSVRAAHNAETQPVQKGPVSLRPIIASVSCHTLSGGVKTTTNLVVMRVEPVFTALLTRGLTYLPAENIVVYAKRSHRFEKNSTTVGRDQCVCGSDVPGLCRPPDQL